MTSDFLFEKHPQDRFKAFIKFHEENPAVWSLFKRHAIEAYEIGARRFSARTIIEHIRWSTFIATSDPNYMISNNHIPYYSRLIMGTDSRFPGFFQIIDSRFDATIKEIVEACGMQLLPQELLDKIYDSRAE